MAELRPALAGLVAAVVVAPIAVAEEGGSGHYVPGVNASFIDMLPGKPSLSYVNMPYYWTGSRGAAKPLELGGQVAVNVDARARADTSLFVYQPAGKILGADYGATLAIPFVRLDVTADIRPGRFARLAGHATDKAEGIGDITILPLMLGWSSGDFKWGANLGVYAPTGSFTPGRLANLGKNYWTVEPALNASWLSTTIGVEATVFAGLDLNTRNDATDYQSGNQAYIDLTLAQHVPLLGGVVGLGANAFLYQQVSADRGSGAALGGFEAHAMGVGPVLSYIYQLERIDLAAEAKWLPDLAVDNRLKGDSVFLKLAVTAAF